MRWKFLFHYLLGRVSLVSVLYSMTRRGLLIILFGGKRTYISKWMNVCVCVHLISGGTGTEYVSNTYRIQSTAELRKKRLTTLSGYMIRRRRSREHEMSRDGSKPLDLVRRRKLFNFIILF